MATRDDIFKWAIRNNKRLPMTSGDYINMPAARAFYIDAASRENIGDGNSSAALSERAKERKRYNDGRFAPEGNGNAGKANMNRASANDSEKSVDKLAKREKAIKLGSGADTQRYFLNDDNFLKWEKGLSQEERDAIKYYTSDGYKKINSLLRKVGDWNADEKIWQYIANPSLRPPEFEAKREDESFPEFLARRREAGKAAEIWEKIRAYDFIKRREASLKQSVLDFELSDDIITYRVIGEDAAADILPNSHYTDAGYMSTSPTLESSAIKKDKALMIIKVPKGKGRGAYIEQETMVSGEYELLLNAGSRFAITDKRKENGRTVITMEMII